MLSCGLVYSLECGEMTNEWLIVRPGVIALSGTELQIRYEEKALNNRGEVFAKHVYLIFLADTMLTWDGSLYLAKKTAERKADELREIGKDCNLPAFHEAMRAAGELVKA